MSAEGYSDVLSEHPSGVYFGWAGLSNQGVYKMVMSIGWNPYFNNTEKTIVSITLTWMVASARPLFFSFFHPNLSCNAGALVAS